MAWDSYPPCDYEYLTQHIVINQHHSSLEAASEFDLPRDLDLLHNLKKVQLFSLSVISISTTLN